VPEQMAHSQNPALVVANRLLAPADLSQTGVYNPVRMSASVEDHRTLESDSDHR